MRCTVILSQTEIAKIFGEQIGTPEQILNFIKSLSLGFGTGKSRNRESLKRHSYRVVGGYPKNRRVPTDFRLFQGYF